MSSKQPPDGYWHNSGANPSWRANVPNNEIGGIVTTDPLVAYSSQCGVQLETFRLFSIGWQLVFRAVGRWAGPGNRANARLLSGFGDRGKLAMQVEIKLSDGQIITNNPTSSANERLSDGYLMTRAGTIGGLNTASLSFFLTPLPPVDSLTITVCWPLFGIDRTSLTISSDVIIEAARHSLMLWPADL